MKKLLAKKQEADTECDGCGERFMLWDALEKKFASEEVRKQVEELQANDIIRLDTRRKGKLLALEVSARITSADQKCFEIPATEDEGLDMELEFTDEDGKGTGQRLYLQLKAGNSYLRKRKDGAEIFTIKKKSWVRNWLAQPHPVMLVIGTFARRRRANRKPRQTGVRRGALDGDQQLLEARKRQRQKARDSNRLQRGTPRRYERAALAGQGVGLAMMAHLWQRGKYECAFGN